jgi:hypothetical protein
LKTLYHQPYTKTQLDRLFGLNDSPNHHPAWQTITDHPPLERIAANF